MLSIINYEILFQLKKMHLNNHNVVYFMVKEVCPSTLQRCLYTRYVYSLYMYIETKSSTSWATLTSFFLEQTLICNSYIGFFMTSWNY